MIRQATALDAPRLVAICHDYHPSSHWAGVAFDLPKALRMFEAWIEADNVAVLMGENSLLVGCATAPWFSEEIIGQELLFYAADKSGTALREAFEAWVKDQDAVINLMGAQEPGPIDLMARWYRQAGYRPFGRAFVKDM
jgi:hypothetical protein